MSTVSSNQTLSTLNEGALEERFQYELGRLLANILDPNTVAKARREIKVTLKFLPDERRAMANLDIIVETKLAPRAPLTTAVAIKQDKGAVVAFEMEQTQLFQSETN
jgi:hypothetical protein